MDYNTREEVLDAPHFNNDKPVNLDPKLGFDGGDGDCGDGTGDDVNAP